MFQLYTSGIYYRKVEEADVKKSPINLLSKSLHKKKNTYEVIQFFTEEDGFKISDLVMLLTLYEADDVDEMAGNNFKTYLPTDRDWYKQFNIYVDRFTQSWNDEAVEFNNVNVSGFIISKNDGTLLSIKIKTLGGKSDINDFRFLSSKKPCYPAKIEYKPL